MNWIDYLQVAVVFLVSVVLARYLIPWQARRAHEARAINLGKPTLPKTEPLRLMVLREDAKIYSAPEGRERRDLIIARSVTEWNAAQRRDADKVAYGAQRHSNGAAE